MIEENIRIPYKLIEDKDINVMRLSSKDGVLTPHISINKPRNAVLKEVRYNDLVFNPRRINIGGIALFKEKNSKYFVSSSYRIIRCTETLLPDYLYLVLRTKPLLESIGELMRRDSGDYLSLFDFREIPIPLPSLTIQREIVDEYNETLLKMEKIEHQISCMDKYMEEEIINSLGIGNMHTNNAKKKQEIALVSISSMRSWYVPQLLNDIKIRNIFNTKIFPRRPLIEFVEVNPLSKRKAKLNNMSVPYVSNNSISKDIGEIETYKKKSNDFLKGDLRIFNGDILLAKNLNGIREGEVAIVNFQHHSLGYTSSDFFVLRSREDSKVAVSYIYYLLRSKLFRQNYSNSIDVCRTNKRLNEDSLKNIELPILPEEDQASLIQKLDILNNHKKKLIKQVAILKGYPREKELLRKLFFHKGELT
ncbi:restriction endonuclease subunit S [Bacillus thuringiensis]|uniref:restriction endonuclease subunit S n=1 Tax=Bacillus thuringiensis TaxID=1428 RepID=UPI000BFD7F77|nr:restriction endonuclease subunit S [Bacillus thuringiensis]PGM86982.1 hypothetical protein CN953_30850 [Bacillus thuringiensis]